MKALTSVVLKKDQTRMHNLLSYNGNFAPFCFLRGSPNSMEWQTEMPYCKSPSRAIRNAPLQKLERGNTPVEQNETDFGFSKSSRY